jgi:hypothetical protein
MDCPRCKLVNPATAVRCDCGYDLQTGTMQDSYLTERDKHLPRQNLGIAGAVLAILLTMEFMLRLSSAAVARHSVALGALSVILVIAALRFWLWVLNGRGIARRPVRRS